MTRGDIVTVVLPGDYGKPRPAVIIQSDLVPLDHTSVIVCPLTSTLHPETALRMTLPPSNENGLKQASQVMIDKPHTVLREKIGKIIGRLTPIERHEMDGLLTIVLGLT